MIAIARHGVRLPVSWLIGDSYAWSGEKDAVATVRLRGVAETARRSKSALQTTPWAVTALSRPALKALGAMDLDSRALVVPGTSFSDELSEGHIAFRGIGSGAVNPSADPRRRRIPFPSDHAQVRLSENSLSRHRKECRPGDDAVRTDQSVSGTSKLAGHVRIISPKTQRLPAKSS
jgi:hypothetical protein